MKERDTADYYEIVVENKGRLRVITHCVYSYKRRTFREDGAIIRPHYNGITHQKDVLYYRRMQSA